MGEALGLSPQLVWRKKGPPLWVSFLSLERSRRHPRGAPSCDLQGCTFCGGPAGGIGALQVGWTCFGPLPCPAHLFLQVRVFFFLIFFPQAGPGLSLNTSFGKGDSISIMSLRLDKLDSELCVVGGSIFLQEM